MLPAIAALAYTALMGLHFVGYYTDVRSAPPDTIVDYTIATMLFAPLGLVLGALIGRWRAALLPLTSLVFAAAMLVASELDDRYAAVAEDRGGVVGFDWFGVAGVVCSFAIPGVLAGVSARKLLRRYDA